ncbi:MAG TPA: exodeoxyribonuclease VII large subunit [Burkholderiaceae bacterium]|nr:exodeoxyribonuclease VII large subunit [Burkholderiaceae bacterium]
MIEAASPAPPRPAWGVAALLLALGDALAARFSSVTVQGELSGFSRAASGHCYFTLKDADGAAAAVRCAMFRRAASMLDFAPRDGMQVEVRGRVALYEPRGELQLVVESMRTLGAGSLYEQFLRSKAKLEAEGLFDAARKRALPTHPRAIGVVTSTAGAALHDVLTTLARRAPQVAVVVYPSLVQGAEAPGALVAALGLAAARREVDLVIVARGGGSIEDLWAFNDERVVRAIAALPMPSVAGVGHETDVTLVDFVADLRAPTPTAAAELAAPARDELLAELAALAERARRAVARRLDTHAQRLDRLALQLARPAQRLARAGERLQLLDHRRQRALARALEASRAALPRLGERLRAATRAAVHLQQLRLAALGARLEALDPTRVLARGYVVAFDAATKRPLPSARGVAAGQALELQWHDGRAAVRVTPPAEGA